MKPTKEFLEWLFYYDRERGVLTWRNHWDIVVVKRFVGKEAGRIANRNFKHGGVAYLNISIGNRLYPAHRLIWCLETGTYPDKVDHINGNGLDNRIQNLRSTNTRTNGQNQFRHRNGKLVGASFFKPQGTWRSYIHINKKQIFLGYHPSEQAAHECYLKALKSHMSNGVI